jgi:redox-sensitive bicupin YhaK (pirin superfamily)
MLIRCYSYSAALFLSLLLSLSPVSVSPSSPSLSCAAPIPPMSTMKTLKLVLPVTRPHWVGDGFNVYPLLGQLAFSEEISPFLMLDYAAPKRFEPTSKKLGVGQHPHRGFETVTMALQGEVEHGDSEGNRGVIGPGDVQWMTAASGIIHEEFHSSNFAKTGGHFEMVQLWVNLPAKYKMTPPKYQPILSADIPVVALPGGAGSVRVVSGDFEGTAGAASTHTPVNMWVIELKAGQSMEASIPEGHNTIVFVRSGAVTTVGRASEQGSGSARIVQGQISIFSQEGSKCSLQAAADGDAQIVVLSGEPINEPVAARGPFVMNTQAELGQAMDDYQRGRFGKHFASAK